MTQLAGLHRGADVRLSGWAFVPGVNTGHNTSELDVWLEPISATSGDRVALTVTRGSSPEVDVAAADPRHDHAEGWFDATVTAGQLADLAEGRWRFRIALRYDEHHPEGAFGSRDDGGSAGLLAGDRSVFGTVQTGPGGEPTSLQLRWDGDDGLVLDIGRGAVTAEVRADATGWQLSFEPPTAWDLLPGQLVLEIAAPEGDEPGEIEIGTADESGCTVPAEAVQRVPHGRHATLALKTADGVHHPICWQTAVDTDRELTPGPDGRWWVRRQPLRASVTAARIDPDTQRLHVAGQVSPPTGWQRLELTGPRETWSGPIRIDTAGDGLSAGFTAEIALIGSDTWEHQGVVPLAGTYQVGVVHGTADQGETVGVEVAPDRVADLPRAGCGSMLRWRFDRDADGLLQMRISQPLTDDERSKRRQAVLQAWSRTIDDPLEDAVYFESFAGKFASCSPGAIFAALRERRPDLRYYWGIRDHAVPVPDGGVPVLMHSREWWRVRATSRYLVTNSWVQRTFAKRPGQQVVQTWHGTPYKRLALDRDARSQRFMKSTRTESATWDYLLAQSDYMAEAMVSAYGYPRDPLRTGYPRNDVIHSAAADPIRARLRGLLNIADDQQVLLYAPTWREDRTTMVDELDLGELAQRLGPDYVILARGHGNVLRRDHDHSAAGVIDVTSYPDATHLYLTADLAMTDYSSVMFDYTVTGKPLLFFVPDIDRYTSTLRGVYFDLGELAPGPLLRTLDEVVEQVRGLDVVSRDYADRYQAWQEKFNTWDDGHATDRVLDAAFSDLL